MLLSEARAIVRSYIDEPTALRWADSILNTFIKLAIQQVQNLLISSGNNMFHQSAAVSASNGVINITTQNPVKILSLSQFATPTKMQIQPIRPKDANVLSNYSGNLELVYVPHATLPTIDGDALSYGAATASNSVLDQLVCVLAARSALVTDNEPRAGLEALKQELEANIKAMSSTPSSFVMPSNYYSTINRSIMNYYISAPNTIQLITRI